MHRLFPSGRNSQDQLVDYLRRSGLVKSPRVEAALRAVDRRHFINEEYASPSDAYDDHPLPIGAGQTISAPHMHAICLELLEPHLQPGARAMDVGSGSGYLLAAMAKMVGPNGYVLGVEKYPELVQRSLASLRRSNPELFEEGRLAGAPAGPEAAGRQERGVRVVAANALSDVLKDEEPFDAVHVGAAAEEIHKELVDKLKPGGRMVIPVGPHHAVQTLMAVDKDESGVVHKHRLMDVGYVPLTRPGADDDE